ncbi:MAG: DNA translocase FtsK [Candidatus Omnitrophica bacterium]|nr:DNA translocase FtsK [Candidatus Omnitrophota bacterium]
MKQQRINEITGFVYLAIGILILVSLLTYSPDDLGIFTSTPNQNLHNFVGIIGAYISGFIFFLIGKSGFVIPFLCLVWALSKFTSDEEETPQKSYIKIAGTLILFLAASSILALTFNATDADMMNAGGISGLLLSSVLYKYFGTIGAYIILITLLPLSILLATDFLIIPFVATIYTKTKEAFLHTRSAPAGDERERPRVRISREPNEAISRQKEKPKVFSRESAKEPPVIKEPKPLFSAPKIKIDKKPDINIAAKKDEEKKPLVAKAVGEYKFPSLDLLDSPPPVEDRQIKEDLTASSAILEDTLRDFGIEVKVAQVEKGPVITRYELEPAPGVKVNRITALNDDIALTMKAQTVRIIAPIPGKSRVGIEVPNTTASLVYLKEVLSSRDFQDSESKLTLALGKDTAGIPVICDLAKMPHLLIAGTTGSGKTVCVNSIILSMLYNASPDELKFILVDPKMVEMAMFNKLPHLICPVLTDAKKAAGALNWLVSEMESRYKLLAKAGARNITAFNQKLEEGKLKDDSDMPDKLPFIVLVIDELADLMAIASNEIENAITRLAQLSRAVGIHIILATQRPSVDVITGVIKANFPARISFKVASKVDSRTVLDMNGADKLLGKGDMLFMEPGVAKPTRAQSSLVSDKEIERVIGFISSQREAELNEDIIKEQEKKSYGKAGEKDEFFDDAVKMILETGQASVSMIQRRMRLSYTRAARMIDSMEEEGIVGPYRGSKPREILVDPDEYLGKEKQEQEEEPAGDAV